MMGLPEGHITGVPGLSRNDMLRLGGGGVVPQQGATAIAYLLPLLLNASESTEPKFEKGLSDADR